MSKRRAHTLNNPGLVFSDLKAVPILELNIDQFPEQYKSDWYPFIIKPTKKWLKENCYRGKGTIWAISNLSLNFGNEWVQSVFVIVQGFSETFFGFLYREAKYELGDLVTCLENTIPRKEIDGWQAVCHVEKGKVYRCEEADEWEEVKS